MNILNKLGLGQKKKAMVPLIGEKMKKEQAANSFKHNPYVRILIFILFILISIFSLPRTSINSGYTYSVGQPWRSEDLTAPFTFALQKTSKEIEEEKESIRKQIPPIFIVDENTEISIQTRLDSIYSSLQPLLEAYTIWQTSKLDKAVTLLDDSLRFSQEYSRSNLGLTEPSVRILLESYFDVKHNNRAYTRFIGVAVKQSLETIIEHLLNQGVINHNKANLNSELITIRNPKQSTEQSVNIARIRDLREANEYTLFQLNRFFDDSQTRLGLELYNKVMAANYKYSKESTETKIAEAIANISDTKGVMAQGQVIIRRGDIVTPAQANILESLNSAKAQNASEMERWLRFLGGVIAIIAIALVFFMYLYLYRSKISSHNGLFFLVFLVMGIITLTNAFLLYFDVGSPYIVPVAIAPLILTIIFDSRVGIVAAMTLASLLALVNGNDFEFSVATFTACSMGVFSVRDIKNRAQFFFTTPGIILATYIIVTGAFSLTKMNGWDAFFANSAYLAINTIFILFTYPIILLLEKLFGVTTDFTLIELSDTNQPLLKDLMNRAPGTFHHSLQVANLAETAASAIGANPLLCRVGALYHDVGKMIKPEYFVENQAGGANEHDKLKPQMSAMVIKAHVSEGVKMAREHGLPDVIINFIETHHGTSVIRYFFEKAKEDENLKNMLNEDLFRYEGPLPATKETGILLLADGIEAASRAMKNPSYPKLEGLVNKMVDDRVKEGQLSNCPLTFRNLRDIKQSFLNILVGVYHSRIEYPEEKKTLVSGTSSKELQQQNPIQTLPADGENTNE